MLLSLMGCISMPDFAQYDAAVDHYAETKRFDAVSFSVDTSAASAITSPGLSDELTSYLTQFGIRTVAEASASEVHIELTVHDSVRGAWVPGASSVSSMGVYTKGTSNRHPYRIDARIIVDGSVVDAADLYYIAWSPQRKVREQQLASMIADDLLLIWHPVSSASWLGRGGNMPAPFALAQNAVEPQTQSGQTELRWEAFPSARALDGSGLAAADISNVSYEVRIQQIELKEFAFSLYPAYDQLLLFTARDVVEPRFTVPFVMPSCGSVIWSVRAHFTLNDHPRVTEWAGSYYTSIGMVATTVMSKSTLPPHIYRRAQDTDAWRVFAGDYELMHHSRVGTITQVVPPNGIDCGDLDWGILYSDARRAQGDFAQQLTPVAAGEAIGAKATISRQCTSERCEFEPGIEDGTRELAACLRREFRRRSMDVPVVDLASSDPSPDDVRYILDTTINISEGGTSRTMDSDIIGTSTTVSTAYSATFETSVIDAVTGEIVGAIDSAHRGSEGRFMLYFLVLPIMYVPYGSVGEIQDRACDELARYASFVLRGGVATAWPDAYFKTESDPLW